MNELTTGKKSKKKLIFRFTAVFAVFGLFLILGFAWETSRKLPKIMSISDYHPKTVTSFFFENPNDGSRELVAEFFKERRYVIPFEEIPKSAIDAFVSAEDNDFFEHDGISFIAIARAAIANFRAGHVVQGGSTITQQVAKSLFLSSERKLIRKLREAILARRLEDHLSKDEILFLYLNQIYLGHGAYGIEAAAKAYFNKRAKELSIQEVALLAGMPRAPSSYNPFKNPTRAKERQVYVLKRMFETGKITKEKMDEAIAAPLKIHHLKPLVRKSAEYYVEHVRREGLEKYGEDAFYENGMEFTLPGSIQLFDVSFNAVQKGLRAVDKRRGFRGPLERGIADERIAQVNADERNRLLQIRFPYDYLGNGELLSPVEVESVDIEPKNLFNPGDLVRGVVTDVNDKEKSVTVEVAGFEGTLKFDSMSWAHAITEDYRRTRLIDRPSQALKKGDLVQLRFDHFQKKENDEKVSALFMLEQEPNMEAALFSFDAKTGRVLALQGGYDFARSEFNRAVQAKRQVGSTFKTVVYTTAIENGYTPMSIIVDKPITLPTEDFGKYKPSNYSDRFYGETTLRKSFIKSRNVTTVQLALDLGISRIKATAARLGVTAELQDNISTSLGSGDMTLLEIASVYGIYPRFGYKVEPVFLNQVKSASGEILFEAQRDEFPENLKRRALDYSISKLVPKPEVSGGEVSLDESNSTTEIDENEKLRRELSSFPREEDPKQVMDPRVASVMTDLLEEVVQHGTGQLAKHMGRAVAGKTGTTDNFIDAWFLGFSPDVVTGVWVGFDNPSQTLGYGETGSKAALPIWIEYMGAATAGLEKSQFVSPTGVTHKFMDKESGKPRRPRYEDDPEVVEVAFISGTEPKTSNFSGKSLKDGRAGSSRSEFLKQDYQ